MKTFRLTVSSPNGNVYEGETFMLSLRGVAGDLAILAGHIPFTTAVVPCDCKIELPSGEIKVGRVESGILSVGNNEATLLTGNFAFKE